MKDVIKVRKTWGDMKPVTKVKQSNKAYSRKNKWGNRWED